LPTNLKTLKDRATVTIADQQKVVYDLSNGNIFNDLERPKPWFQRQAILWHWISPKWLKIPP